MAEMRESRYVENRMGRQGEEGREEITLVLLEEGHLVTAVGHLLDAAFGLLHLLVDVRLVQDL